MTEKKVLGLVIPIESAAWRCPAGTDWIPERNISPNHAEYWIQRAIIPAAMAETKLMLKAIANP